MTRRPEKKSEMLEVRLSHSTKQAFMAHCRAHGHSASEAVRGFIEAAMAGRAERRARAWRLAAGVAAAAAVGAVAAPSLARSPSILDALDADGDGKVSVAEFLRHDADGDGAISAEDLRRGAPR